MKYCKKCGSEMNDEALFCAYCGEQDGEKAQSLDSEPEQAPVTEEDQALLGTLIKIFLIVTAVLSGFALIPLLWTIPMTTKACKTINEKKQFSIAFSILTILFFSQIGGIMMLFYRRKL